MLDNVRNVNVNILGTKLNCKFLMLKVNNHPYRQLFCPLARRAVGGSDHVLGGHDRAAAHGGAPGLQEDSYQPGVFVFLE